MTGKFTVRTPLIVRCVHCHDDVLCRWDPAGRWEFDHFCLPPSRPAHVPGWVDLAYRTKEKLPPLRPNRNRFMTPKQARLISPLKNQTINRIKPPGAAVSSSEKRAQTRANSGVAKNPSKQKRRFLAKKNQTNNQTSH